MKGNNPYRKALIEHFDYFTQAQRQALAARFGAPTASPETLASTLCMYPERLLEQIDEQNVRARTWQVVEDLAYDHDLLVDIAHVGPRSRNILVQLGLLKPSARDSRFLLENSLPAALAAMLAPRLPGARASLPMLLGHKSTAQIEHLARLYLPQQDGSRIELLLDLCAVMSDPLFIHRALEQLGEPEWIGAALMALELGGVCYWQEVFGQEMEQDGESDDAAPPQPAKVVPLMRPRERLEERSIAESLQELGLIYRIEEPGNEHALVAVPEELWAGLWTLGREWLMDWTADIFYTLSDQGARRNGAAPLMRHDPREALKWLALEIEQTPMQLDGLTLHDESRQQLFDHLDSALEESTALAQLRMGLELGVFYDNGEGEARVEERASDLLEEPRPIFARHVLHDWCICTIGRGVDEELARSVGLDESWRELVLGLLVQLGEAPPPWLGFEGIGSELTGAGCLRNPQDGGVDVLMMELGLTHSYLWSTKLLWLDLLSLLEADRWYPVDGLRELLQMAAATSLFGHLANLLETPGFGYYLPVQRASFMTDPFHTQAFSGWTESILREFLEPLGLAQLDEDATLVWLDTRCLRVETPMGMQDEQRVELLRELLQQDSLEFKLPHRAAPILQALGGGDLGDGNSYLSASLPLQQLRADLGEHRIVRFDGQRIFYEG